MDFLKGTSLCSFSLLLLDPASFTLNLPFLFLGARTPHSTQVLRARPNHWPTLLGSASVKRQNRVGLRGVNVKALSSFSLFALSFSLFVPYLYRHSSSPCVHTSSIIRVILLLSVSAVPLPLHRSSAQDIRKDQLWVLGSLSKRLPGRLLMSLYPMHLSRWLQYFPCQQLLLVKSDGSFGEKGVATSYGSLTLPSII